MASILSRPQCVNLSLSVQDVTYTGTTPMDATRLAFHDWLGRNDLNNCTQNYYIRSRIFLQQSSCHFAKRNVEKCTKRCCDSVALVGWVIHGRHRISEVGMPSNCGVKLHVFIHSQTSTVKELKFGNGVSNFTPHLSGHVIALSILWLKLIHASERVPFVSLPPFSWDCPMKTSQSSGLTPEYTLENGSLQPRHYTSLKR